MMGSHLEIPKSPPQALYPKLKAASGKLRQAILQQEMLEILAVSDFRNGVAD